MDALLQAWQESIAAVHRKVNGKVQIDANGMIRIDQISNYRNGPATASHCFTRLNWRETRESQAGTASLFTEEVKVKWMQNTEL